jgi:ATP-dependent DNA helicase RecQ
LAEVAPANLKELEAIRGIGQEKLNRYGSELLAICAGRGFEAAVHEAEAGASRVGPATVSSPQVSATRPSDPDSAKGRRLSTAPARLTPPRAPTPLPQEFTAEQAALEHRIREWRREQAAAAGLPSFFILSDTALRRVVAASPKSIADLREVSDVGPDKLERYGPALLELCRV